MSPDQRARALRLADEMERGQTLGYSWGVLDAADLLRELAAEPVRVPLTDEEIDEIESVVWASVIGAPGRVRYSCDIARAVERAHGIV